MSGREERSGGRVPFGSAHSRNGPVGSKLASAALGSAPASPRPVQVDVAQIMAAWAMSEGRPRLVLADDCTILWCDQRINTIALNDFGLSIGRGKLAATHPPAHFTLAMFINEIDGNMSVATFRDRNHQDCCIVMRGRQLNLGGTLVLGIELVTERAAASALYAGIREAFGLTVAEERFVQKLLDGRTAAMVAADLDITVDTARSHIRQIYAKIGINSREALFHRLRAYCID
ncbi:helix-turn-helix transcriptional regulator [Sphingomonas sp. 28-62-11]|uniref:helix-turn-helix transcriptional regulator n=1 Tax=Sphingomonas sp. 28-62-11 TaxID=1970432 RepID=UPI0035A92547